MDAPEELTRRSGAGRCLRTAQPTRHMDASMPNDPSLTLALWATNLATPLNGLEAWAAHVEAKLAEAAAAGAKLLVMPEYACEAWLSFKPAGLAADQEVAWMAEQAPAALDLLRPLPARHGVGQIGRAHV